MSQLQQQITSFISTAKVDKLSAKNTNNAEESAFTEKNGDKQNIINPAKRLHSCLSSSSDHSICIENELDEIKQSLKNVPKKSDLTEIVTEIFKSLSENLKKQIKKEIMSEVKSEVEKLKTNYDSKISHLHDKLNTIEFENGNLLETNASLHSDLRKMREVVDENNKKATESVRLGNWNEQYSRKKNVKIYHLPENRNEDLPHSLLNELKNQVKLDINPSEVVAMHRIPGKEGNPRPVLIKFLRMDTKISLLRKKKAINEALKVRIGDDITKLNQGLLNRLYQHDNVISSWYFNGHVYGSDEEGTRHRSIIQFLLLVAGIEQNPGPDQSNKKNLKIVHNNVCSLLPKLDLINNELHDYDIICISESHLDKSITDDQIKLNGFHKPIRLDRNRHGGGVTIYIKNSLHFIIRNDISVSNLELLWVEVRNCSNEKFLVGVLYRPPNSNSNLWDLFSESVDKALDCNLPIFLCGDFNCDMMSNSIEISFKTFKQHSFKRQIRDFKRADYEGLKNQLNDTDWDDVVFNSNNINDVYMNFVKTFESTVNRYIPTKTITVRPNDKPFMNNLIRNKIRHRNRIHHKAKTSNNPDHWKKFREIRNEIISLVRKAKDDYKCKLTSQLIDKNIPPGKWWRIAKSVSNFTKNRDSPFFGT
ncbi:unnamed protein product [Mytilus edulis]|uniref:Endonuclease/exonuclease/phosphatase domain-containing protein n=1 Tax=Mytilus edulis TaxID=6550 RepID=A0A8S3VKB6_MYTED|nr:unnamed protein product [Mytilus edulis]